MGTITASGIIVFRNNYNNPEILGLIALPKHRKRAKGTYDIPKGSIDTGESPLEAAKRECFEESGLRPKLISSIPIEYGPMQLWIGEVDGDSEIIIASNPHSGEVEHEGYEWISIKKAKKNCLNYLKPFIVDAEKIIWDYFKI
jgi:8-oxo-dGTP pyrophosphatase MutT (NUDIX family)|tara:strand:+ start:348 stop:776 length:429 start_codon:yes stop_codon:yes gene_type:complete